MNSVKLYPYKMGSESGKDIATLLGVKRVKPDGRYVPRVGHTIINWGSSKLPSWYGKASRRGVSILNPIDNVKIASNKLTALEALDDAGIAVPHFTTDKRTARFWLEEGETVLERHKLKDNSGRGIRIVNLDDELVENTLTNAPLYVKFIPKSKEFRVHVFQGRVIDYAEKKKRRRENRGDEFNKYICSNEMGWVFCRNNISHIDSVKDLAIEATSVLGLDFAAVDVIFSNGKPYILETNTAPGIMGTTLRHYTNAFRGLFGMPELTRDDFPTPTGDETRRDFNTSSSSLGGTIRSASGPESDTNEDMVPLYLDRATALKVKQLLEAAV